MLIHGTPIAVSLPSDPGIRDRFWYWSGASGKRYIHSVFALDHCPPLPGAPYVAVKRQGALRIAVGIGQFSPFWDNAIGTASLSQLEALGVDELHVHLLAKTPGERDQVVSDLALALEDSEAHSRGFAEDGCAFSPAPEAACARAA